MVRRLISLAEEERGAKFDLAELYHDGSDDSFISFLGGVLTSAGVAPGKDGSEALARAIRYRDIYGRSFAFASRHIAGLEGLPPDELRDTRALLWNPILHDLSTEAGCMQVATAIYQKAR